MTFCLAPQANETFAFVGNVTHYAKAWLNISPEIRAYLEEGRLQRRIRWLQQVGQGFTALAVEKGSSSPQIPWGSSCDTPWYPPCSCGD